jgi:hypothetical protein
MMHWSSWWNRDEWANELGTFLQKKMTSQKHELHPGRAMRTFRSHDFMLKPSEYFQRATALLLFPLFRQQNQLMVRQFPLLAGDPSFMILHHLFAASTKCLAKSGALL